jgi:hypothetical protein
LRIREAARDLAQVGLEAADHHLVAELRLDLSAAHEALRVEDLEQRGE